MNIFRAFRHIFVIKAISKSGRPSIKTGFSSFSLKCQVRCYANTVKKGNYRIYQNLSVKDFAKAAAVSNADIVELLQEYGYTTKIGPDSIIEPDIAELLAEDLNVDIRKVLSLYPRPPIVALMGHVDHGKTTLLDYLRKSSIVADEAGGITQKVAAFKVTVPESDETITFIDTPGHAAFSMMRARGVNLTDIVVLVIAADDGVMKQTEECIRFIKESQVPLIVAINKIDKPNANPDKIKSELAVKGIQLADSGGDVEYVKLSALKGTNIDQLLLQINSFAKDNCFVTSADPSVEAVILEAEVNQFKGILTSAIVRQGKLKKGMHLLAGNAFAKIKQLYDTTGSVIPSAGPSDPVQILGWKTLPDPGEVVIDVKNEGEAKQMINKNSKKAKKKNVEKKEEASTDTSDDTIKALNIIIKSDVSGSLEAIINIISSFVSRDLKLNVITAAVGNVNETDLNMADTFDASIYCFNVTTNKGISKKASSANVRIRQYNVIYKLLDDLKIEIESRLPFKSNETDIGEAEVLKMFRLTGSRKNVVAGCRVISGVLDNSDPTLLWKVLREGEVIHEGSIKSLKHGKTDVQRVEKTGECGVAFKDFEAITEGDRILCVHVEKYKDEVNWNL